MQAVQYGARLLHRITGPELQRVVEQLATSSISAQNGQITARDHPVYHHHALTAIICFMIGSGGTQDADKSRAYQNLLIMVLIYRD